MVIGKMVYDHYEHYFGKPDAREIYTIKDDLPSIQVLEWSNIMEGCTVLGTMGITHFYEEIGTLCEVITVVDTDDIKSVSSMLANALFASIEYKMHIKGYKANTGLKGLDKKFYDKYNKNGIFWSYPFPFPKNFSIICGQDVHVPIFMAVFITSKEYNYYKEHGADKLESLWEDNDVDVFILDRVDI